MEAAALSQLAVTVELDVSHTLVRLVTSTANLSPDDCRVGDVGFINSNISLFISYSILYFQYIISYLLK